MASRDEISDSEKTYVVVQLACEDCLYKALESCHGRSSIDGFSLCNCSFLHNSSYNYVRESRRLWLTGEGAWESDPFGPYKIS